MANIEKSPNVPPFVRYCAMLIPTVFDDSLSYYEAICALSDWLQENLVEVVNNNAKVTEEYIALVNELKDYVKNYFENLDVQEEINNKLDQMAESGQLADIIAQYLQVQAIFGFDTIAEMSASENLAKGSICKVLGKNNIQTGDGSFYKIRTVTSDDVIDGVNKVAITNDNTLIAEIIPNNYHIILNGDASADDVQRFININGEKIIEFAKDTIYTFDKPLHLTSGTHLELNNATLNFNFTNEYDETIGIYNYFTDSTFKDYNGAQNVSIRNGTIKKGCIALMHGNGTLFENLEFVDIYCRHCIQIAGSKDTTIKSCTFNGVYANATYEEAGEVINIDPTTYAAQPYLDENSIMYDGTFNRNIYIEKCTFKVSNNNSYVFYIAIGSHVYDANVPIYTYGLQIKDCIFETPYAWAISLLSIEDVIIDNNQLYGNSSYSRPDGTYFVITRYNVNNVIISNNTITGINKLIHCGGGFNVKNNITISGNYAETINNDDQNPALLLQCLSNSNICNNTIKADYILRLLGRNADASKNHDITISNNTFETKVDTSPIRIYDSTNIYFVNNSISVLPKASSDVMLMNTNILGDLVVENNKTNNRLHFTNINYVTRQFNNNGALYPQTAFLDNVTSSTGNLNRNATYFKRLHLLLGGSSNTQVVTLTPFIHNNDFLDDRTYKAPIVKNDNTIGYAQVIISNDGATYTYNGDLGLRRIYTSD